MINLYEYLSNVCEIFEFALFKIKKLRIKNLKKIMVRNPCR